MQAAVERARAGGSNESGVGLAAERSSLQSWMRVDGVAVRKPNGACDENRGQADKEHDPLPGTEEWNSGQNELHQGNPCKDGGCETSVIDK